ncbi:MAG: hypothetical protein MUF16_10590 [Burkholderiaceae bacterium]|nr:hypothetical protein [Burkholderiaceae bacterium]
MKTMYPLAVDAVRSTPEAETSLLVIHEAATDDADGCWRRPKTEPGEQPTLLPFCAAGDKE